MKHTLLLAAICIGLIICAVGYSDSRYKTSLGRKAPDFYAENGSGKVSSSSIAGDYTLLNFWSSADASSRQAANLYTAWMRKHPETCVRFVSVNLDDNEGLFREIVRLDSLVPSQQYHVSGDTARAIVDNYGLKDGYGTLLINPAGTIVAHNPKVSDIPGLIR